MYWESGMSHQVSSASASTRLTAELPICSATFSLSKLAPDEVNQSSDLRAWYSKAVYISLAGLYSFAASSTSQGLESWML
jgi:hypothetical protein